MHLWVIYIFMNNKLSALRHSWSRDGVMWRVPCSAEWGSASRGRTLDSGTRRSFVRAPVWFRSPSCCSSFPPTRLQRAARINAVTQNPFLPFCLPNSSSGYLTAVPAEGSSPDLTAPHAEGGKANKARKENGTARARSRPWPEVTWCCGVISDTARCRGWNSTSACEHLFAVGSFFTVPAVNHRFIY